MQYIKRNPSTSERFGQAFANAGQAVAKLVPEYYEQQAKKQQMKEESDRYEKLTGMPLSDDPEIRKKEVEFAQQIRRDEAAGKLRENEYKYLSDADKEKYQYQAAEGNKKLEREIEADVNKYKYQGDITQKKNLQDLQLEYQKQQAQQQQQQLQQANKDREFQLDQEKFGLTKEKEAKAESEKQEIQNNAQSAFNKMASLISSLGRGSGVMGMFGGKTAEKSGEFTSLSGALEALLVDKVSRGTLSNARFEYITETLLPKPTDTQDEIKGKMQGLAEVLGLDASVLGQSQSQEASTGKKPLTSFMGS